VLETYLRAIAPHKYYSYYVHHDKRLCFLRSAKCASSSVLAALKDAGFTKARWGQPKRYFTFTVVRNPYDRLVSSFEHVSRVVMDGYSPRGKLYRRLAQRAYRKVWRHDFWWFVHFVEEYPLLDRHWVPQHYAVSRCDDWIEFEDLQNGLNMLLPEFNVVLPHVNATARLPWQDYCTPYLKQRIYWIYQEDFERLGYGG